MKLAAPAAALLLALSLSAPAPSPASTAAQAGAYDADFTPETMRLDLFHTAAPEQEHFAVDRVVADGPWPASKKNLLDPLGLGTNRFEVADVASGRVLFSFGYSTLFAEWETTPEAKKEARTFHESLRFPWPRRPVEIRVFRRDAANGWKPAFTTRVDPNGVDVNPANAPPFGKIWTLFENGSPNEKVDLLVLGEGYTEKERTKFHADVARLVGALFREEPFKSRKGDFNVRAIDRPAPESGVLKPQKGVFRRTPLSVQYNVFGSERYALTTDNRALRDAASTAPYDFLEILVNDAQYGGGGIYAFQATAAAGAGAADYLFVHEFGHHFAGLADEYYTSDVAYETGVPMRPEPWEPNATALRDAASLKWKDLVEPQTPLPTPWEKEAFEAHARQVNAERRKLIETKAAPAEFDALFVRQGAFETKLLSGMPFAGTVGAFEGAAYEAKGLYRPAADCLMFSRNKVGFCPVCRRAIERVIGYHAGR